MKLSFIMLFIVISAVVLFSGCDKDNNSYNRIPYAPVNIHINPNSTQFQRLNTTGNWEYITAQEPSRGLIVYRYSKNEFKAFERTCPHNPENPKARVEMEENFLVAVDSTCMSRFLITDGSPFDGPSRYPLKQYRTSFDGVTLHIYN